MRLFVGDAASLVKSDVVLRDKPMKVDQTNHSLPSSFRIASVVVLFNPVALS